MNLRMMESESIALPLGDSPLKILSFLNPGLSGFEPPSAGVKVLCLNRLATAHHSNMIGKSAKRDSNSRPSPWQGDALPLSHSRKILISYAQTRNRTKDTRIFSPLLYQLSYLGKTRVAGFEPANDGIRIRCLTAWRYPTILFNELG